MTRKKRTGAKNWTDPDDAPELTKEWFRGADIHKGGRLVRRGRPPLESPKQQITLRLDADVIEGIRATGPGWSGRVNDALRRWVDRRRKAG